MALTFGTRLGPYEVLSALGAGGMGEVYRAKDTRLERTVAVKILPASVAGDPERLLRFQHEARILSTLNHPNVLAIFDVGEQNGLQYLVSEFLEGRTLREVLASGPLSRRALIAYSLEIAKGLAAAHEKGVVHRDLKPENIFITRDDRVKILDFGLAKLAPAESAPGAEPTMTAPAPTTPGTVMGTVGYMSPEQVRGQGVDHRSDIFSFGTVLYEMGSGKRAFRGDSSVETMNAILKEDVPDLSGSAASVSPALDRIIHRCVEKKPERRFQSASDLAFAIEALSEASGISHPASTASSRDGAPIGWIIAAVVILGLAALSLWLYRRPTVAPAAFTQISFRPSYIRMARFAPGGVVVYAASINGEPMTLFSVRVDTFQSQALNLNADLLSISRSGELAVSLGRVSEFWTPSGRLARVPLGGGATREILDDVIDADWTKDGTELAISRRVPTGSRLEFPPGKVLYETAGYVSDLRFSPANDQIAFLDHPLIGDDRGWLSVIDLEGHRRVLTEEFGGEQGLAWSPSGREIWFTSYVSPSEPIPMRAVDLKSGKIRTVASAPARLHLQDISLDGKVLLSAEEAAENFGVVDTKSGHLRQITTITRAGVTAISNDGNVLLLNGFDTGSGTSYQLYIQRTDGSPPVLIGEGAGAGFSPDGTWAAAVDMPHPENLLIIPTSVGDSRKLRAPAGRSYSGAAFLADNKHLLITTEATGQFPQSAIQDLESGSIRPVGPAERYVVAVAGGKMLPGPSPDSRLCIQTDSANHYWLQPLDGGEAKEIQGIHPREKIVAWHGDSNNVFLSHSAGTDTEVYNLNLTTGERKRWTRFSPPDKTGIRAENDIFITPDGSRFAYVVRRINSALYVAEGLR